MTEVAEKNTLSRDQLRSILAGARNNAPVEQPDVEAIEYDWKRPHMFHEAHRVLLSQFVKQVAGEFSDKFTTFCNEPSRVIMPAVWEYYCEGIKKSYCDGKHNYYMVFADNRNHEVGVLIIPYTTAIRWTAKMLCDTAPEVSEEYEMSNLEESLLADLCETLVATFSEILEKHELEAVHSLSVLSDRDWPMECLDYDEFSMLKFEVENNDESAEAYLVIMSSHFGPMLEIDFPDETTANNQNAKEAVMENLKKIPVEVDVMLGRANISLSSLMNLAEGDVILLERKATDPLEALIEEKVYFHGFPAKTLNRYALSVTDMVTPGDNLVNK